MGAIETTALTKRFGDVTAVEELDLTIEEGEIFGFLGPNGAGKSTTINMLLDFISPTNGSATVLGYDTQTDSEAIRERTGVLPEGFGVFDRLTAREHVEWVIETKDADDDPDEILDTVGLGDAADRAAGGYSKGMAQRMAYGMALVGDPELLILDEPSSGLDPNGIQEMRELLREQAADGTTVFFSSHILSEVEAVCDRIGIMNEGSLVALDSIDALQDDASSTARIDLELQTVPDSLGVETLAGVQTVSGTDAGISVHCSDPTVKVDVVEHVTERATITDILSEDTSLEQLFNRYTTGGTEGPAQSSSGAEPLEESAQTEREPEASA